MNHEETPTLIPPRKVQVGGNEIHRLLPFAKKRMVGPFIFFDHFPHTYFQAGQGLDVRPHPHIGLSTLSYLLEGEVLHHDSLGNKQVLVPGDVNWMTAGKGISHSERLTDNLRNHEYDIQLLQFWVALPQAQEDCEPSFFHYPQSAIPQCLQGRSKVCVVAGEAFGKKSPVACYSKLFFLDTHTPAGETFEFAAPGCEIALYVISGAIQVAGADYKTYDFIVLPKDQALELKATADTRYMILGGEAFPEERYIFWNFVSSSKTKIDMAAEAWRDGSFPQVPGESDVILLPEK